MIGVEKLILSKSLSTPYKASLAESVLEKILFVVFFNEKHLQRCRHTHTHTYIQILQKKRKVSLFMQFQFAIYLMVYPQSASVPAVLLSSVCLLILFSLRKIVLPLCFSLMNSFSEANAFNFTT